MHLAPSSRFLALFAAMVWISGCGSSGKPRVRGRAAPVERGTLERSISASGPIQPAAVVEVKSRASGEIRTLPFEAGDQIPKGETLATIDPREETEAVRLAEADLLSASARVEQARLRLANHPGSVQAEIERAQARVLSARADRDRLERDYERQKGLRSKGLTSDQAFDQARGLLEASRASLEGAKTEVEILSWKAKEAAILAQEVRLAEAGELRAQVALDRARERLDDTTIRARIGGVLLERLVEPGQIIASGISNVGGGTTLMVLADTSQLLVQAQVDETDMGRIFEGQEATILTDTFPDRPFPGKITWISPKGKEEADLTSFEVLVEILPGDFDGLRVGMTATCTFVSDRAEDVLHVPPSALRTEDGQPYLVLANEKADGPGQAIPVEVGLRTSDRIEVRAKELSPKSKIWIGKLERPDEGGERRQDPIWFLKKKPKKKTQ